MVSKHAASKRLSELTETFTQRGTNKNSDVKAEAQYQIPLFRDLERAIPNPLARSSLFAPVARGRRKQHNGTVLMSRADVVIRYIGQQLDMGDQDVFMQAIFEAQRVPLGERVFIKRSKFLQMLHRSTGKSDYNWLHESFKRIFTGSIEIETKNYKIGGTPTSAGIHLLTSSPA